MTTTEIIGICIKAAFTIFMWWFGDKLQRDARAKEVSDLLIKITKDGDRLAPAILAELSKHSQTNWNDIPIRPAP